LKEKQQPCLIEVLRAFMKILDNADNLDKAKEKTRQLALRVIFKGEVET